LANFVLRSRGGQVSRVLGRERERQREVYITTQARTNLTTVPIISIMTRAHIEGWTIYRYLRFFLYLEGWI
jgi:hypothetical protein